MHAILLVVCLSQADTPLIDYCRSAELKAKLTFVKGQDRALDTLTALLVAEDHGWTGLLFGTPPADVRKALKTMAFDSLFESLNGEAVLTEVVGKENVAKLRGLLPKEEKTHRGRFPGVGFGQETPYYLRSSVVLDAIKATPDQRKKIAAVLDDAAAMDHAVERVFANRAAHVRTWATVEASKNRKARVNVWREKLLAPLDPAQKDKLVGIRLGMNGKAQILNADLKAIFGITKLQETAFFTAVSSKDRKFGAPFDESMKDVLTPAQEAQWVRLRVSLPPGGVETGMQPRQPSVPPKWAVDLFKAR